MRRERRADGGTRCIGDKAIGMTDKPSDTQRTDVAFSEHGHTVLKFYPLPGGPYSDEYVRREDMAKLERELQAKLTDAEETHCMQLAAISTASIQNTPTATAERIESGNPYWTVAYQDVCVAVDREIRERERAEKAEQEVKRVSDVHKGLMAEADKRYDELLAHNQEGEALRAKAEAERDSAYGRAAQFKALITDVSNIPMQPVVDDSFLRCPTCFACQQDRGFGDRQGPTLMEHRDWCVIDRAIRALQLVPEPRKPELSPSEALYAFAGWLTGPNAAQGLPPYPMLYDGVAKPGRYVETKDYDLLRTSAEAAVRDARRFTWEHAHPIEMLAIVQKWMFNGETMSLDDYRVAIDAAIAKEPK